MGLRDSQPRVGAPRVVEVPQFHEGAGGWVERTSIALSLSVALDIWATYAAHIELPSGFRICAPHSRFRAEFSDAQYPEEPTRATRLIFFAVTI